MLDYLYSVFHSYSDLELFAVFLVAFIFLIVSVTSLVVDLLDNIKLRKRFTKLEHRIDNLEGFFKFNPDGTVVKVSDLDIDCETVDINKPTK